MNEIDAGGILEKFKDPAVQNKVLQIKNKVDKAAKNFERRNRVTDTTIFLMLFVSIFYDTLQFLFSFIVIDLGLLSFLVGVYAWLTFYVWTSIKGWSFSETTTKGGVKVAAKLLSKTKWAAKYVLPFIALIPVVNSIPEITAGVLLTLMIVKSEDFMYNKSQGRIDEDTIKQGLEFFNLLRKV